MRKLLTATAAAALTVVGAFIALPAQAVLTPLAPINGNAYNGQRDTQSCSDEGGVLYTASVDWNYRYVGTNDVIRASVSNLVIKRSDSEIRADDAEFDVTLRVYSTNTLIQRKVLTLDPAPGTGDLAGYHYVKLNPANPVSNGDRVGIADSYSKIVLTIGTDADGLGDCTITFRQPDGLKLNTAV